MPNAFDAALAFVLRWESGYSNRSTDAGRETYRGISRRFHPHWSGWGFVDAQPHQIAHGTIFPELETAVRAFYREQYWDRIHGDDLPPRLALVVFDWAVHSGVRRASIALQMLVGAPPDGVIGPKTLASVAEYMDRALARELVDARRVHLAHLGEQQPRFAQGWANRVRDLGEVIG